MPLTVQDFLAAQPNIPQAMAQGSDYVNGIYDQAAKLKAGQDFSQGNYQGAAQDYASRGDLQDAESVKNYGASQFQLQHEYIQRAVPIFQDIYNQTSKTGGPQAGADAVAKAFDTISPDLKTLGVPDQQLGQYRAALASDPVNTLNALNAVAARKFTYQKVGDDGLGVFEDNTGQMIGYHQGAKFITAGPGQTIIKQPGVNVPSEVDGASAPTGAPDGSVAAPAPAPNGQTAPAQPASPAAGSIAQRNLAMNNPGNLRVPGQQTFQSFPDMQTGIGAVAHQVQIYGQRGINTLSGIISTYAPQSDGNNTQAYISDVAQKLGIDPNAQIDPTDPKIASAVANALITHEQGGVTPDRLLASNVQPSTAQPLQQPHASGGAQVVFSGGPQWRAPTADELKTYPGAVQINAATNEVKYPPMNAVGLNMTDDQKQPLVDVIKAGGILPARITSNPIVYAGLLQMAKDQGVDTSSFLANQANRKATVSTFANINTRLAVVNQQEEAFQNSLNLAYKLAQQAGPQTGGTLINGWRNYLKTGVVGDPATGAFINAVNTAMNEYGKIIEGSTGNAGSSISARADANSMLSGADNLPAFVAKMQVLQQDAGFKIGALQGQHDTLLQTLHGIGSPTSQGNAPPHTSQSAPSAAPQNFKNGQVYTDAKGNHAVYMNGKWLAVKK